MPEAQMDRFLMHIMIGYGDEASEAQVIRLVREESTPETGEKKEELTPIPQEVIFNARNQIAAIHTSEAIEAYLVDVVSRRDIRSATARN